MNATLLFPILIPAGAAICVFLLPKADRWFKAAFALIATAGTLLLAALMYGRTDTYTVPWGGFGMDFSLRLYSFSGFILLAAAAIAFLIVLYSSVSMKGKPLTRQYYGFLLLTLAFVNGAVLSNNLVVMLFFWEGLLVMLYAMITTGGAKASPTAVKALVLNGVADFCMLLGVGMAGFAAGTLQMDKIHLPMTGLSAAAFVLMMIGAIGKAGAMPFHSWIPDAAVDAPTPFMAFLPGAIEKLLGIYLLTRISMDLFQFASGSAMSIVMMSIGAVTILFAVLMALIQKDYKRLLSYHAISQVGYMILGVGTALPIGIAGGLFHMVNNAIYKSGLFLTAGNVEKQTGTTDLHKLGGLGRKMPWTTGAFLVLALSISGVPPFNGFFSKELIFDAALESGWIFYACAVVGAFFTAASFLKLGHAAYFGKQGEAVKDDAREAPWPMALPAVILAALCVLFGLWNTLPLNGVFGPIIQASGHEIEHFTGLPGNWMLAAISVGVLLLALANHGYGVKRTGKGLGAVDHIHYAPGMKQIYNAAEKKRFDPYEIGMAVIRAFARVLYWIDRGIDWFYNKAVKGIVSAFSWLVRKPHNGTHWMYILWALGGVVLVGVIFLGVF